MSATVPGTGRLEELPVERLLDLSWQIFCVADFASTVLWCNRALADALGFDTAELVGSRLVDLLHPDDPLPARAQQLFEAGGYIEGIRGCFRRKDGIWRVIEASARVDRERRLVFVSGFDVTEREAADETVRRNEARLRALLDHSPSSIFVKDLEGRYLEVNRKWSEFTGVAVEEAVGKTSAECLPVHQDPIATKEMLLVGQGSPLVTEERLGTPEGERVFLVDRFLLRDAGGEPYALCGMGTEITEKVQAELALADRQRRLRSILEASPDIVTIMDEKGKIRTVSGAEQAITGRRHDPAGTSAMFALVHPDDIGSVTSAFGSMCAGEVDSVHVRYRVRHADGHYVTLDSRAQALTHALGKFTGAAVVTRDVSNKLQVEDDMETARLAAEEASRAKSEFLSRMSHELRTPLNSILGFSQLMGMDELPSEQADAVDHILRAGRHLLNLIDEVLDIARIETGHLELQMSPVSVAEIVAEAMELTAPMARRLALTTKIHVDAPCSVNADRQRLLQVLLNLLSNAAKYNRPGGRIDVVCEPVGAARVVRLSIADSGRGIRQEDLGRVFEPFDRMGAEQSGIEGTGMGLALSRQLVEHMGGTITVESEHDVGTTFHVELSSADSPPAGEIGGLRHEDDTFCVVHLGNDLSDLDLVERVLSRRPRTEVLAALLGRLGLDLAREHRADLVIVDLPLADMTAETVLQRLGADPLTADIPVVLMSDDPGSTLAAGSVPDSGQVPDSRRVPDGGQVPDSGQVPVADPSTSRGEVPKVTRLSRPIDVRVLLSLVDSLRQGRQPVRPDE